MNGSKVFSLVHHINIADYFQIHLIERKLWHRNIYLFAPKSDQLYVRAWIWTLVSLGLNHMISMVKIPPFLLTEACYILAALIVGGSERISPSWEGTVISLGIPAVPLQTTWVTHLLSLWRVTVKACAHLEIIQGEKSIYSIFQSQSFTQFGCFDHYDWNDPKQSPFQLSVNCGENALLREQAGSLLGHISNYNCEWKIL